MQEPAEQLQGVLIGFPRQSAGVTAVTAAGFGMKNHGKKEVKRVAVEFSRLPSGNLLRSELENHD